MKRIKKLTYVFIFSSVIISGCGRKNKEAAVRLEKLDENITTLYNEEKNDLHKDISEEKLAEITTEIKAIKLQEKELNEKNATTFGEIETFFIQAKTMYEFDQEVQSFFEEENVLKIDTALEQIEDAERRLADFDIAQVNRFIDRQEKLFITAKEQIKTREHASKLLENLFENENTVQTNVTRAQEKETHEAVEKIKNQSLRKKYKQRLEKVNIALTKSEEAEEQKKKEAKERQETTQTIGDFAGMYLSEDNFIYFANEKIVIVTENTANDTLTIYDILEIKNNTGREITLKLYEKKLGLVYNPSDPEHEEKLRLSEDKKILTLANGYTFARLSEEETQEIFSNLNALEGLIEEYSQ